MHIRVPILKCILDKSFELSGFDKDLPSQTFSFMRFMDSFEELRNLSFKFSEAEYRTYLGIVKMKYKTKMSMNGWIKLRTGITGN